MSSSFCRVAKRIKPFFLFCFVALNTNSFASEAPANFPPELLYKNKPIDPLCLSEQSSNQSTTPLEKCGLQSQPYRHLTQEKQTTIPKDFIGYEYTWGDADKNAMVANCYSYYKIIGKINNQFVIFSLYNSGGTGQFSNILLVTRKNDQLQVNTLEEGDRCNGGINQVQLSDNKITFNANLTAADFFSIAGINMQPLRAYDDLSACAICCLGTANFALVPSATKFKEELISVELPKDPIDLKENQDKPYQLCFDKLISSYQQQGKYQLSPEELRTFLNRFKTTCVAKKA